MHNKWFIFQLPAKLKGLKFLPKVTPVFLAMEIQLCLNQNYQKVLYHKNKTHFLFLN